LTSTSSLLSSFDHPVGSIGAPTSVECFLAGCRVTFETGKVAGLANGSVWARMGDTVVLCTAVTDRNAPDATGFLPLTVDYRERAHATGRIPRTRDRRDGQPSDQEVLAARVIDRVVRPLFPSGFVFDSQLLASLHSSDGVCDPVVTAVNAASAALCVSDMPWNGPAGCVRVGLIRGELVVNPDCRQLREEGEMDLLYAGTIRSSLMLEMGGQQISPKVVKEAMKLAHSSLEPLLDAQMDLSLRAGRPKSSHKVHAPSNEMADLARKVGKDRALELFSNHHLTKAERGQQEGACQALIRRELEAVFPGEMPWVIYVAAENVLKEALRDLALEHGIRCDGRTTKQLRDIVPECDVLPRVHGSALFSRGQTQSLATVTLGPSLDLQQSPRYLGTTRLQQKREQQRPGSGVYLHYDFPPFSVDEVGKVGGVNRRMVGHGNLAEKAIIPVLPARKDFPYQARILSEVTMSNGSSSMASVCAASLALMDAGVPISAVVSGISVGILVQNGKHVFLGDILGTEDHYGDMDFKVASTDNGVTAMQLDVKDGDRLRPGMLADALVLALKLNKRIREIMSLALDGPRPHLKPFAPLIKVIHFDRERRRDIIGINGETLRGLEEEYDVKIDLSEEGVAILFSPDPEQTRAVAHILQELVAEAHVGDTYMGTVVSVQDYGALIEVLRGRQGLLHISELSHARLEAKDVLEIGQKLEVKCVAVDPVRGLVKLSRKALFERGEVDPELGRREPAASLPAQSSDSKVVASETIGRKVNTRLTGVSPPSVSPTSAASSSPVASTKRNKPPQRKGSTAEDAMNPSVSEKLSKLLGLRPLHGEASPVPPSSNVLPSTASTLRSLKVNALKDLCKERGLKRTGTKETLIERLELADDSKGCV
jgi:polyribonucleotide nucleotidyltransferase